MKTKLFIISLISAALGLSGCGAHKYYPYIDHPFHPNHAAIARSLQKFNNPKHHINVRQTFVEVYKNYNVTRLQFPSVMGNNGQPHNNVDAIFYKSRLPGKHQLLIVLPIWGGSVYPSEGITNTMLRMFKGNINLIRVLGPNPIVSIEELQDSPTTAQFHHLLKILSLRTKNTIIDMKALTDWAAKQSTVSKKIIVIGFSKSTVTAGILAQTDPNITGAIFVMGGSNPADMIDTCDLYDVEHKITTRFNWSKKKVYNELHQYLGPEFNIAHYPTRLNACHVLDFDSYYDLCVLRNQQDELWRAMDKPLRISFMFDHRVSFAAMTMAGGYYMRRAIYRFLSQDNCTAHIAP